MNGKKIGIGAVALVGVLALAWATLAVTAGGKTRPSITLKSRTTSSFGHVLAAPNGHTLYRLSPETTRSLLCKSSTCLGIWKPLTVASKNTTIHVPSGVTGSKSFLKRGSRWQVVVSGHPLYTYIQDMVAGDANGQRIHSFGGTWFLRKIATRTTSPPTPAPGPTPTYPGY